MNCQICGEDTNGDQRTVRVACMYDLTEAGLEDNGNIILDDGSLRSTFGATVCKNCRGDLIGLLRRWRAGEFTQPETEVDDQGNVRNIPVRVDGSTRMMSITEFAAWDGS